MITGQTGLGFNPLSAVKKVATTAVKAPISITKAVVVKPLVATKNVAQQVARGNIKAAVKTAVFTPLNVTKDVAKTAAHVTKQTIMVPTQFALEATKATGKLALRPVKSRVNTLVARRANKIAWDKRKSRTPNAQEHAEARSWTKSQLNKKLPHGPLLALLAGPLPALHGFGAPMTSELGVAPATLAALVPLFIAILNALLSQFSKSGEAPAQIGPDGQPIQVADPTAVPDSMADMGPQDIAPGMDPSMVDAAAAAAGDETALAPGAEGGMPGMPAGVKKGHIVMIGAILAGVVIIATVMKKPASSKKA